MDAIHDLGGKQGFGPIDTHDHGVGFETRWHGLVFTIVNALLYRGIAHNVDHFRHSLERIDPVSYLSDGYYGRWLGGAETLLVESELFSQQELTQRAIELGAHESARIAARPFYAEGAPDHFSQPPPQERAPTAARDAPATAKFRVGQIVRTGRAPCFGHTRLPGYARGVCGEVIAQHGAWVFPDTNAHGLGEQPQHLYTVAFTAEALWGDGGESGLEVCLDLFEPYLTGDD
jgi:nitrile hydratase subunit beta